MRREIIKENADDRKRIEVVVGGLHMWWTASVHTISRLTGTPVNEIRENILEAVDQHFSVEEIEQAGKEILDKLDKNLKEKAKSKGFGK